uniref:Uncharacterized protein n=1 Tax=Arundo donax TaxID=35708 RepID=A0A0A9CYL2_ARUDO
MIAGSLGVIAAGDAAVTPINPRIGPVAFSWIRAPSILVLNMRRNVAADPGALDPWAICHGTDACGLINRLKCSVAIAQ